MQLQTSPCVCLQAQGFTWATLIELIPTFLAALLAAPLALIAAAATHMAMTWILKSAIIGSSRPGTHWCVHASVGCSLQREYAACL